MEIFRYCVRPNSGTVDINSTAKVGITLNPGDTDERHKFMVQTIKVPENFEELDANKQQIYWSENVRSVMNSKLVCEFKVDKIKEIFEEVSLTFYFISLRRVQAFYLENIKYF